MSDPKKLPETSAEVLALVSSLQGGLGQRLAVYLEHSKRLQPEFAAVLDRMIARIDALDGGKIGPAVGDRMPDFLLPDQHGRLIALEALLELGPVVISMNRGHWCPYCQLDLRALAEIEREIRRMGAQLVSIIPETAQFTKKMIADNNIPFPILSDIDLSYALSLGLIYWIGAEIKKLYADFGLELERFQGNRNYLLPITAKFIVGRDGVVKAREVNVDFRQRMEPKAIIAALERL